MSNKKQIALRLEPSLIKKIDDIRPHTTYRTRTELIETACTKYVAYLRYCLEEEALEE